MKTLKEPEDPILSPAKMAADGDMSEATWYATIGTIPRLKIIQVSPRRIGARHSNWRQVLDEQTEGGAD